MRTIIAGSRSFGYEEVEKAMEACGWMPTVVISGGAPGVDQAGEQWGRKRMIPVEIYPAEWRVNRRIDRGAGYRHNEHMAADVDAEALVAVWEGEDKITAHMIECARKHQLEVFVFKVDSRCA